MVRNKTCAITGHRDLPPDFDYDLLISELKNVAESGYEYFLDGLAIGFDTACFRALETLRRDGVNVKIVGVVPCADQSRSFTTEQKAEYERMKKSADILLCEEKKYFRGCMLARNDFLVDNSSLLFAYYSGMKRGGTYYTVNRALKNGVAVNYFKGGKSDR